MYFKFVTSPLKRPALLAKTTSNSFFVSMKGFDSLSNIFARARATSVVFSDILYISINKYSINCLNLKGKFVNTLPNSHFRIYGFNIADTKERDRNILET